MVNAKLKRTLQTVTVICFTFIFITSVSAIISQQEVSREDFPLEIDLSKQVYTVGENITFTVSIINRSGRDVNMSSNGAMPCVYMHNVNDTIPHGEIMPLVYQAFNAGDRVSRTFEYNTTEAGTFILDVHYSIGVDGGGIQNKLDEIQIEVR